MNIIENNYDKERIVVCPKCKSVLGVKPSDIRYDSDADSFLDCPLCKHYIYLGIDDLLSKPEKK